MDVVASGSSMGAVQQAFNTHSARADRLSRALASDAPGSDRTFVKDMAELPTDAKNVGIQAKVIKTKDNMQGALIDILA